MVKSIINLVYYQAFYLAGLSHKKRIPLSTPTQKLPLGLELVKIFYWKKSQITYALPIFGHGKSKSSAAGNSNVKKYW